MITYTKGDATLPRGDGRKIIAHICNNVGSWGSGFVMALSERDRGPEEAYRKWLASSAVPTFLGKIQICPYDLANQSLTWACNMIAQDNIGWHNGPPIRYHALAECLACLGVQARVGLASVHMPRIGCGLAGGKWDMIEPLIKKYVGVSVTVYDLE